jgi:lipid-A-disaccharide synthase
LGATTAICASGTATLECALAAIAPVIVYRTDRLSAAVGRALLDVDEIGLPNLVLGRRLYPELLQEAATPHAIAQAVISTQRDSRSFDLIARSLLTRLLPDDGLSFGARVAAILEP